MYRSLLVTVIASIAIASLMVKRSPLSAIASPLHSHSGRTASDRPSVPSIATGAIATPEAPEIARAISVRILTATGSGSGAIVARQGQTYTVLTNHHVIADGSAQGYSLITPDGQMQTAWHVPVAQFADLDLALVQFTSANRYRVAAIAHPDTVSLGETLYAAGFEAWHFTSNGNTLVSVEDTRQWGIRAFRLTTGRMQMRSPRSLVGGYEIGYTNDVVQGMSGGPVLTQNGELIAINGKLKYPFLGIRAFIFADGSMPSPQLFAQMESLSWAIPITKFQNPVNSPSNRGEL